MRREQDAFSFSDAGVITWGAFAADVAALRPQIAVASDVCNALPDRYEFMVGLAAALLNEQTTVLPSAAAYEAVGSALDDALHPLILGGAPQHDDLSWRLPTVERSGESVDPAAMIAALETSTTEIHVFTSGTTKRPQRHIKNWSTLAGGAALTEAIFDRLGFAPGGTALLGTTPHQHMYGLEATVFAGLAFGHCTLCGNVFFPADLEAALEAGRRNGIERVALITSPAHLKFLEDSIMAAPEIVGIVSATAPLPVGQAERLEARGDLPVMEIYGSTETGSLAIRRTIEGPLWTPLAGFTLEHEGGICIARAPHLPLETPLSDDVRIEAGGQFELLGRIGDMVSINGKRSSLAALNAVLIETPGLSDGVMLHRAEGGHDRLAIVAVVGDGISESDAKAAIRRHLHRHLDPIFTPRRIVFTDRLPRGGTGKIPAAEVASLTSKVLPH